MFTPQQTQDGSFTFFSTEFNEAFHSHYGAKQESFLKFAVPTRLPILAETGFVRLLDVCYGLGYNTAAASNYILILRTASINCNSHTSYFYSKFLEVFII